MQHLSICMLPIWLILCFLNAARPSEQAGSVGNVALEVTELHQRNISTQKWHRVQRIRCLQCRVAAVDKLCNKEKTSSLITSRGIQQYSGILRRHQGFPSSAGRFCDSFLNNAAANVARWSSSETSREEPQAPSSSVLLLSSDRGSGPITSRFRETRWRRPGRV